MNPEEPSVFSEAVYSVADWTRSEGSNSPKIPPFKLRYRTNSELGRGGMGVVHAVTDRWLEREVALKRPLNNGDVARRMLWEAGITARLNHPSIPPIFDVGEDEEGPYYTMPVLRGQTLERILEQGRHELDQLIRVIAEAAFAVGYAHKRGVVHRDMKSQNLLVGPHNELWVLDWGVAFDASSPDQGRVGTPGFMAPEQEEGSCSPASDVYGLGRVLEQVLKATGTENPELEAVVRRSIQPDPDARYPEGTALGTELMRWLAGKRVEAHDYTLRELLFAWMGRRRGLLTTAGAFALLVVGGMTATLLMLQGERNRTEAALSRSLVQQAATEGKRFDQAGAEVLAVEALERGELPAARGELMRWAATPRVEHLKTEEGGCQGIPQADGRVLCLQDPLLVLGMEGDVEAELPLPKGVDLSMSPKEVRLFGEQVLVLNSMNTIELWEGGQRRVIAEEASAKGLAIGGGRAFFSGTEIRYLGGTGVEKRVDSGCEGRIEALFVDADTTLVACRSNRVIWIQGEERRVLESPASIATVTFAGLPLIGTFDGAIGVLEGEEWEMYPTGMGAPTSLLPLEDGLIAVNTEISGTRFFSVKTRLWVGQLPMGALAVSGTREHIRAFHASEVRDYRLPESLRGTSLIRPEEGGISCATLGPEGREIAFGSATGHVGVWNLETGEVDVLVARGENVTKDIAWSPDGEQILASNGRVRIVRGRDLGLELATYMRSLETGGDGVFMLGWGQVLAKHAGGDYGIVASGDTLWSAQTMAENLWVTAREGTVYELYEDALLERFRTKPASLIRVQGEEVITANRSELLVHSRSGEVRWTWEDVSRITALTVDERYIVVGNRKGDVSVLSRQGTLLATVGAHERLVSDLVLRGDDLFTFSWDGTGIWMGLMPLEEPVESLRETMDRAWKLDLFEVLGD